MQFVQEAWNEGETVVLAIIDYDSFFENIWHDLALIKLHELGIRGKTLKILYSYLKNRKFCFEVNGVAPFFRSKGMSKGAANSVKRVAVSMLLPDIFV